MDLPEKLNATFEEALNRTAVQPKAHAILAKQVLSWISCAKRPLSLAELREALSVEPGDTKLDRSGCPELELLLDVCCGLVIVDEEDNVIRLVHYSFQQYLEVNPKADLSHANWNISHACLTYLMWDDFSPEATDDIGLTKDEGQDVSISLLTRTQWRNSYRFFLYVASYWCEHVRGELEGRLETLILCVFDQRMDLLYSLQGYNKIRHRNLEYGTWPHEPSPLHLTCYWGLGHIIKLLIARGIDVNATDTRGRTPLFCAAMNGQANIIQELVDSGANVNTHDITAITPLHASVANDHLNTAKLLLQQGVDVNAIDHEGSTPLSFAASNGNTVMMDLLQQMGAVLEPDSGLSPLESASRGGRSSSVQWRLAKGVSPNATRLLPLIEAVYANHAHIVRILLDAKANVDAIDRLGNTAMEVAVVQGNVTIIRDLVAAGADTNDIGRNTETETPLQEAAYRGDKSLAERLIKKGADVHAHGGDLGTVLQCSMYSRDTNIVKLILGHLSSSELSVDHGIFGATPIQLAVVLKDKGLLTLLLGHGSKSQNHKKVDTDSATPFCITPLHRAVYLGWKAGINILLRDGANPNIRDLYGRTALDWCQADKDLFSALGGNRTHSMTSPALRERTLTKSIQSIISQLLPNPSRKGGRKIAYHYLGHCLLMLGDTEEATTSFEQQIIDGTSKYLPEHNILCHSCGQIGNINGSRFICYACADIDLCERHMEQYHSRSPDVRCKGHKFLEIPGLTWGLSGEKHVNRSMETIDEWLWRLQDKYSDNEALLDTSEAFIGTAI